MNFEIVATIAVAGLFALAALAWPWRSRTLSKPPKHEDTLKQVAFNTATRAIAVATILVIIWLINVKPTSPNFYYGFLAYLVVGMPFVDFGYQRYWNWVRSRLVRKHSQGVNQ